MSKVSNSWLEEMPANTFKGNLGEATGPPEDISIVQLQSAISTFDNMDGGTANSIYTADDLIDCGGA